MEEKFYDFCMENGYDGHIWVVNSCGAIEFTVRKDGYSCSLALKQEMFKETNVDVLDFTFDRLKNMMEARK